MYSGIRAITSIGLAVFSLGLMAGCDSSGDDDASPKSGRLEVSAKTNIFIAGASSVPGLAGGGGFLPKEISIQKVQFVEFSTVEGTVTQNPAGYDYVGADGGSEVGSDFPAYGGISGLLHSTHAMFLVGVFLGDGVPSAPAPERLDVTGMNGMEEVRNLQIGQLFFVGDGRTGTSSVQRFYVPAGATRLFLGFLDHRSGDVEPGYYGDNDGQLSVRYTLHF